MSGLANAKWFPEEQKQTHSDQVREVKFAEALNNATKKYSSSVQSFLFKWSTMYNLGFSIAENGTILVSEADYNKLSAQNEYQFNIDRQAMKMEDGVRVEVMGIIPPQSIYLRRRIQEAIMHRLLG